MGLLDIFLSDEKKIQKHVRRLTNRDSTPEDREASARWLADHDSPQALVGMLKRFDMNLDSQLKDKAEKEFVYSLILGRGNDAIEPTKAWLRSCKNFALPIKLLRDLAGEDAQLEMAFELLDIEIKRDDFKPDKKKALLIWFVDVKDERLVGPVAKCLADFDEGVRVAAAEVLIAQSGDAGRGALEQVFTNEREDSNRLKIRVAETFMGKRWSISEDAAAGLPQGFVNRDGRVVAA